VQIVCMWSSRCHRHPLLPHLNPHGFTFLVPAYPGCPGKKTVKLVYVYEVFFLLHTNSRVSEIYSFKQQDMKTPVSNKSILETYRLVVELPLQQLESVVN